MASVFGLSGLKFRLGGWRGLGRALQAETQPVHLELVPVSDERHELSELLENLVIPQLVAGHAAGDRDSVKSPRGATVPDDIFNETDIENFARLSVHGDTSAMLCFIDGRLAAGSGVEAVFVQLLAPAARRLGEYWEEDSGDFIDVTMGLWRIQEILRELTTRMPPNGYAGHGARGALFSTMPGEQHSFGTLMVSECFERAGWETTVCIEPTQHEIVEKVAKNHFDLMGLTVSCDCPTATITSLVRSIRAVSANPHMCIMLGGRVINEHPELVQLCGADGTAIDAQSAVALADALVPARADVFECLV